MPDLRHRSTSPEFLWTLEQKPAVIEVVPEGLLLQEIAPDTTVDAVRKATGAEL